ncbi:hypothetical protein Btru_018310, partial [Bulinus truncatus]
MYVRRGMDNLFLDHLLYGQDLVKYGLGWRKAGNLHSRKLSVLVEISKINFTMWQQKVAKEVSIAVDDSNIEPTTCQTVPVAGCIAFYQMIFIKGVRGRGFVGDISIDDLLLTHNACPHRALCDFEQDVCGFSQEKNDDFDWKRVQHIGLLTGNSPTTDHTMNSDRGYYMYLDSSSPRKFGDKARIVSPVYPGGGAQCVQFYYYMNGADIGSLFIYLRKVGKIDQDNLVWTMHMSRGNFWIKGLAKIDSPDIFQIVFEGIVGANSSEIAVDDIQLLSTPCPSPVSCDFEDGLCTFSNENSDDYDWLLVTPHNTTYNTLVPFTDHTTGSAQGYFAMANFPNSPSGFKHSLLVSNELQSPTSGQCLSLAYYIKGDGVIVILLAKPVANDTVLQLSNPTGIDVSFHWKWTSADITSDTSFYIAIDAQHNSLEQTTIVVDDIKLSDGLCSMQTSPPPLTNPTLPSFFDILSCNFESNQPLCYYTQNLDDDLDWLLNEGNSSSDFLGPEADHTLGNIKGHYIHIDDSFKRTFATARISSLQFFSNMTHCLSFWYRLHGAFNNTLNVYLSNSLGPGSAIWTKEGEQGLSWLNSLIELEGDNDYHKIVFEGLICADYKGDIALDDIIVYNGPCPVSAFCDFEDDTCGFNQDLYDDFDWLRHNGSISTHSTGPYIDHTYGTKFGHYMHIETSSPRVAGDVARILTPVYPATDGRCLKYWYHMYGSSVGTLTVYLRDIRGNDAILDKKVGNFGNQWLLAQLDLSSLTPFQVIFEGTVGSSYNGDIAIDDVEVAKDPCIEMYGCDFEKGLCSWMQNTSDKLDWIINHGPIPSSSDGPSQDHTIVSLAGQYVYLKSNAQSKPGDTAVLDSQMIPVTTEYDMFCFSLWYFMYGTDIGYLNVTIKTVDKPRPKTVFSLLGNQGQIWKQALVNIPKPSNTFQISVIGSIGAGYNSDIALDDFLFSHGSCQDNSVIKGNFSCGGARNESIPNSKVCDFVRNCVDTAADESNCGDCSFQYDWCRYIETSDGDVKWKRGFNGSITSNNGPGYDHFNDATGYYIYVDTATGSSSDVAEIMTNFNYGPSSAACQMQFYYHMFGYGIGQLTVVIRESQEDTIVFEKTGDQGNKWIKAFIDLGRIANPFKPHKLVVHLVSLFVKEKLAWISVMFVTSLMTVVMTVMKLIVANAYPLRTDFEYSYGAWIQDKTDDFDWIRQQGATETGDTGPTRDHTKGTVTGHYAYIETSLPRIKGQRARLLSPILSATSSKKRAATTSCQIVIEATVGSGYLGDIAVDDISLTDGCRLSSNSVLPTGPPPLATTVSPCGSNFKCGDGTCIPQFFVCNYVLDCNDASDETNCGTCNFETSLCGWSDNSVGIFKWVNISASSYYGLLPNADATFNTANQGHYMTVIQGSGLTVSSALFISPPLKDSGPDCRMTFSYYLIGDGLGDLAILLQNSIYTGSTRATTLWTVSSETLFGWTKYSVDIGKISAGYQIVIKSTPLNGFPYAVAIDDIDFVGCQTNTSFNINTSALDCTFYGGDFCGFFESRTDDFDWTLTNQPTPSLDTGPSGDHTTGHDYYIYIESSAPQKFGDKAVLLSALMPPTSVNLCLLFWYHMFGVDIDTLNVYLINSGNHTLIWTRSGSHGNLWRQGEAQVSSSKNYQISFEGVVGHGYKADIALDDISLVNGSCPPQDLCDFEIDLCDYTQLQTTDVFDWIRWANKTESHGSGPSTDHTTNNGY